MDLKYYENLIRKQLKKTNLAFTEMQIQHFIDIAERELKKKLSTSKVKE